MLTDDAKKWLIDKTCADRKYGARPLKRALQKYIEDEISEGLLKGEIPEPGIIEVFANGDSLAFRGLTTETSELELIQTATSN